jgi:hypothetical protein
MPLLIRPVKMNKSIYVRVPNDIAHIIGLDNRVEVSFSFEDVGNELRLIYSLEKSKSGHEERVEASTVDAKKVIVAKPSIQGLRAGGNENGTEVETQELPEE